MRLGLGTVQFGLDYGVTNLSGQVVSEEVQRILELASESGVSVLDTAAAYGNSEKVLGEKIHEFSNSWKLVSKCPPLTSSSHSSRPEELKSHFQKSISELGVSEIYGYLFHQAEDLLGDYGDSVYAEAFKLKKSGKIKKLGVSVYDPEVLEEILGKYEIDLIQIPLNVFDQRFIPTLNSISGKGEKNIEVHVRSAFLQGVLLNSHPRGNEIFDLHRSKYFECLAAHHLSPLDGALGFLCGLEDIGTILVGVTSRQELDEILGSYNKVYGSQRVREIDFKAHHWKGEPSCIDPRKW